MSPRRNLKTTGRWHKKRKEQSGYQFTEIRLQKLSSKTIYAPVEQQEGREIDRSEYAQGVEENNKRYQENPQLYRTRQR
jgi:hypothetical protein